MDFSEDKAAAAPGSQAAAGSDALAALKANSLQASGYAYLVGDAALFASGMLSGRKKEASSGALYAIAGAILARYGDKDAKNAVDILRRDLSAYLDKEGVALPEQGNLSRETLAKEGGLVDKVERFLHAHPTEAANAVFAGAGVQLYRSGAAHNKTWDKFAGGAVVAGALAGLLIPESKEKHEPTGNPITDTWQAIREKPLRLTGALYTLNNVALIGSGLKEKKSGEHGKAYVFKLMTAASYMVANGLMAVSSKGGEGHEVSDEMQRLYESAADIIAAQPPKLQEATLAQMAQFMASQPQTAMSSKEAAQQLAQHVELLACRQQTLAKPHTQLADIQSIQPNDMGRQLAPGMAT